MKIPKYNDISEFFLSEETNNNIINNLKNFSFYLFLSSQSDEDINTLKEEIKYHEGVSIIPILLIYIKYKISQ